MLQPEDERVEVNSMMTLLYKLFVFKANGLSDEIFLEKLGKKKLCSTRFFQPMVGAGFCSV